MAPSPGRWHTREDSGLRLDRDGRWWHDDEPVEHPRIIEAFNRGLRPTDDGRFQLVFGADWCFVSVEDAAYRVLALDLGGLPPQIHLSDGSSEPWSAETLSLASDGVLECRVKAGKAKARFTREAQFALGSVLEVREGAVYARAGGRAVPVPLPPAALEGGL